MTLRTHRFVAATLLLVSALVSTGCAARCKSVQASYQQALTAEPGADERSAPSESLDSDTSGAHLGVAVSSARVDQLLDTVVRETIRSAATFVGGIDLGGRQPVEIKTDPGIADLTIAPAASTCDTCYKITARLDGTAGLTIPVLGERSTSLDATVQFTAPLILETSERSSRSGPARVMLDVPAAVDHGGFGLDAALGELPASWASSLASPLTDLFRQQLAKHLKPIKIAEFQAPSFTAAGLTLTASRLRPVGDGQAFFIAVRSSLEDAPTVSADAMIQSFSRFETSRAHDVALALPIDFLAHAVARGFRAGEIPRSYDTSGRASPRSPLKVTLDDVALQPRTPRGKDAVDLNMGFKVWNTPENGACFSAEGAAAMRMSASNGNLEVAIRDVSFSGGPATQLGLSLSGWRDAEFLRTGATILSTSLSTTSIRIGPADARLGNLELSSAGTNIIVGATMAVPES